MDFLSLSRARAGQESIRLDYQWSPEISLFAYPHNSSTSDENWLHMFSSNMFDLSVGAHSCAMNSRLKAAPTITIRSGREITVVLGVNWRIMDQQISVSAACRGFH